MTSQLSLRNKFLWVQFDIHYLWCIILSNNSVWRPRSTHVRCKKCVCDHLQKLSWRRGKWCHQCCKEGVIRHTHDSSISFRRRHEWACAFFMFFVTFSIICNAWILLFPSFKWSISAIPPLTPWQQTPLLIIIGGNQYSFRLLRLAQSQLQATEFKNNICLFQSTPFWFYDFLQLFLRVSKD